MSLKSTPTRYGGVAIAIHWITALAIFAMLGTGLTAANTLDETTKFTLLRGHAIMGISIGVLTLLRIIWFLVFDKRPHHAAGMGRAQALAAQSVHYALYGIVLVMVASGLAMLLLTGANLQLFGTAPLPLPDFTLAPPHTVHGLLSRLLIVLLIGHIAAALWHQFVRRDHLMARMVPGA